MTSNVRKLAFTVLALLGIVGLAAACTPEQPGGGGGNQSPVAVAKGYPGASPMEIAFSSSGSFDPDGVIVGYLWNFGDGSATSTEENPTHSYMNEGTFVVTLTVTDLQGATGTGQTSVTVPVTPNQAPVAVATATPPEGPAPLSVQFSSAGSNDPDGGVIASYFWDFGDGITSTSANPTHSYVALGNFTATLKVTDTSGAAGTTTVTVKTWEAQISNSIQGRCLDVDNSGTGNGTKALSYPCTGGNNQRWVIEANGRITSGLSATKCLAALGSGTLGSNVGIYDCNGGLNQRWIRSGSQFRNDANALCLAAKDGSVKPGTPMVLANCDSSDPAQSWAVSELKAQAFQRLRNTAVDRCAGVAGNTFGNGKSIVDWACNDDSTLAWWLDPNGYMINRGGLSWCMDGSGGTVGKSVVILPCEQGQTWQRWHVSGDRLINDTNNLCATRSATNDVPASGIVLRACDAADPNQQFALEAPGQWAWQQLRNPVTNVCAGATSSNNNTKLATKPCDSSDTGQSWHIDAGGRMFRRAPGHIGRCVDGNNGATDGKDVIIFDCNTQPWQHWTADGQTFKNNATGLCATSESGGLKMRACNGSDAQRWVFEDQ